MKEKNHTQSAMGALSIAVAMLTANGCASIVHGALGVAGTVDNPKLEFFSGAIKTGENDDWGGSAAFADAMAAVGAFAYKAPTSRDAAAVISILNGDNSVKVSATGDGTGAVIAERYDATPGRVFPTLRLDWSTYPY